MILQNPISFVGSTKRITPLAHGYYGWAKAGMRVLVGLLLILAWIGVLTWYLFLTATLIAWVPWAIWTLNRRHHIYRWEQLDAIRGANESSGE